MSKPVSDRTAQGSMTSGGVNRAVFRAADSVMFRAPLLPLDAYLDLSYGPRSSTADQMRAGRAVVSEPLADPRIRLAIAVGSRSLLAALDRAAASGQPDRQAESKLLRYLIRMATRPTPYGLFAGVGLASFGERTELLLSDEQPRRRARPDMAWLLQLVARLESKPEVRDRLRLATNPAAYFRAGRVVIGERVVLGEAGQAPEVSIRATPAVCKALEAAQAPIPYAQLRSDLLQSPGATSERVDRFLNDLIEQTFLLSDLRPPLTTPSPARHVLERLVSCQAASEVASDLAELLDVAAEWDLAPTERATAAYGRMLSIADRLLPQTEADSPFQVDMAAPLANGQIARTVGADVALAAELLLRLTPYPNGPPVLAAYRQAFLSKYGIEREVPLLELLDPNIGLGAYSGVAFAPSNLPAVAKRQSLLAEIAASALRDLRPVVELDAALLADLQAAPLTAERTPVSLDISAYVESPSPDALDAGEYTVLIGPNVGVAGAARTLSRFAELLGDGAIDTVGRLAAAEDATLPNTMAVELVYLPQRSRSANVSVRPLIRDHEIPVGLSPHLTSAKSIPLRELVVGVRNDRFYVRWAGAAKDLRVVSGHMLNSSQAPEVCRLLSDISADGIAQLMRFHWGPAESFPYLPRVQAGRVVLRPAEWKITFYVRRTYFPKCSTEAFESELLNWRQTWRVPRYVYLTFADNRLLLDLENERQAGELRNEIYKLIEGGGLVLHEVIHPVETSWARGPSGSFASELIVSLIRNQPLAKQEAIVARPSTSSRTTATVSLSRARDPIHFKMPGSEWVYLKAYCGVEIQTDLITGPLNNFAADLMTKEAVSRWFFVRYQDPDHHIRVRFRCDPSLRRPGLLSEVCDWAKQLVAVGLCTRFSLDTYDQELERYGGVEGMDVAERVFCVDSTTVTNCLASLQQRKIGVEPIELAVATIHSLLSGLGLKGSELSSWLKARDVNRVVTGREYRLRQTTLIALLSAGRLKEATFELYPIQQALIEYRSQLEPIGTELVKQIRSGVIDQPFDQLLSHYSHMHFNRLIGINADMERLALGLLQRTMESLRHLG